MDNQKNIYIPRPLMFKYTFHIDDIDKEKNNFYEIKRALNFSLVAYNERYRRIYKQEKGEYINVLFDILNNLFQNRFLLSGGTKAYLTNYSETSGSLIISFTILIIGTVTNYGSIRETIDYFAEDIEELFDFSLNNPINNPNGSYKITSNIQEQNNENSITKVESKLLETSQYNSLLAKIKVDRVLIGFVFFVLLLSLLQNYLAASDTSKQGDIDETKLKNIIHEEIRNQKIDEHLKTKIDTVYVQKK
jgi:hypothetical protein